MTSATLVAITLAIVAGVRKLAPRIDGPWLVLPIAVLVGCASAIVAADFAVSWEVAKSGATSAALAFGFANLWQWAASLLPALNVDARTMQGKSDG